MKQGVMETGAWVKDKAMKKTGQFYQHGTEILGDRDSGWGRDKKSLLYDQSDLPSTSPGFISRSQAATGVALLFSKEKGKGKIRAVSLFLKITGNCMNHAYSYPIGHTLL